MTVHRIILTLLLIFAQASLSVSQRGGSLAGAGGGNAVSLTQMKQQSTLHTKSPTSSTHTVTNSATVKSTTSSITTPITLSTTTSTTLNTTTLTPTTKSTTSSTTTTSTTSSTTPPSTLSTTPSTSSTTPPSTSSTTPSTSSTTPPSTSSTTPSTSSTTPPSTSSTTPSTSSTTPPSTSSTTTSIPNPTTTTTPPATTSSTIFPTTTSTTTSIVSSSSTISASSTTPAITSITSLNPTGNAPPGTQTSSSTSSLTVNVIGNAPPATSTVPPCVSPTPTTLANVFAGNSAGFSGSVTDSSVLHPNLALQSNNPLVYRQWGNFDVSVSVEWDNFNKRFRYIHTPVNGSVYYTYDLMDGSSSFTNAIAWDSANDIQIFVEYNSSSSTLSFIHYRTDKSTKRTTAPLDLNGFYKYWAPDDVKVVITNTSHPGLDLFTLTHTAYNGSVFNTSLTSSDTLITQLWNQANDQSITVDLNLGTHSHRYSVNGVVNTVIYDSVYLFAPPNATAATASVPISLMTGLSEMCRLSGTTVVPPIFNSLLDGLTAFLNIK